MIVAQSRGTETATHPLLRQIYIDLIRALQGANFTERTINNPDIDLIAILLRVFLVGKQNRKPWGIGSIINVPIKPAKVHILGRIGQLIKAPSKIMAVAIH